MQSETQANYYPQAKLVGMHIIGTGHCVHGSAHMGGFQLKSDTGHAFGKQDCPLLTCVFWASFFSFVHRTYATHFAVPVRVIGAVMYGGALAPC